MPSLSSLSRTKRAEDRLYDAIDASMKRLVSEMSGQVKGRLGGRPKKKRTFVPIVLQGGKAMQNVMDEPDDVEVFSVQLGPVTKSVYAREYLGAVQLTEKVSLHRVAGLGQAEKQTASFMLPRAAWRKIGDMMGWS